MLYKTPELEVEYKAAHPQLLELMGRFEEFCRANGLPEPVATHIKRTRDQQESIYWKLIQAQNPKWTEQQCRYQARNRWTWHFVFCALDLRDYIYTTQQLQELVLPFLRSATRRREWEFLYHDVGRGKHLHVGFRDPQWAKTIPVT